MFTGSAKKTIIFFVKCGSILLSIAKTLVQQMILAVTHTENNYRQRKINKFTVYS